MLRDSLIKIFERDLNRLKTEIQSYKNENKLWIVEESINNSAGNLCLHLLGNLNHFIGAVLGNTGYVRVRENEFATKDIPINALIEKIDELVKIINETVSGLNEKDFDKIYPINVFNNEMTTEFFMIHLTTHLNYHLGQINYHRRLLDS
ncbi:MAG: DinB family protein [Bacteroidetes bacterium]|nr:DinB family protein [Bacteroidota bacterium]